MLKLEKLKHTVARFLLKLIKLIISVNVLSGGNRDVDFYVMDESGWRVFKAGGTFYYYTVPSRTCVTRFTVEWHPPENKRL